MSFEQWPTAPNNEESIERLPSEVNDELVRFLMQQFQHLEERVAAAETRLSSRLRELEDLLVKNQ